MVGKVEKMGKLIFLKRMPQVGVLSRSSFLSEGWRLPKKLDFRRTPLAKNCGHVGNHVIFHPCLKFSTGEVLDVV